MLTPHPPQMCLQHQCQDVSMLGDQQCQSKCHGHGVSVGPGSSCWQWGPALQALSSAGITHPGVQQPWALPL